MTAESSVLPAGAKYQAERPAPAAIMASRATQRLRGIRIMGGSTARTWLSAQSYGARTQTITGVGAGRKLRHGTKANSRMPNGPVAVSLRHARKAKGSLTSRPD